MYDVSILVPGIRNERWEHLYNSIQQSCSRYKWELIFSGPNPLPETLKDKDNIKYIQDYGAPTRCRQQCLEKAEGDWVFYAGDDLTFFPNALNSALFRVKTENINERTVLLGKYTEGRRDNPEMLSDEYYKFQYHDATRPLQQCVNYEAWIIMAGLVPTKLLKEIGGWDCQFNVCAVACLDLALRLQNYGIHLIIHHEPFFHAEHLPDDAGDHGPIAYSQVNYDMPLLHQIYQQQSITRTTISLDNWKNSPEVWGMRFGKNE